MDNYIINERWNGSEFDPDIGLAFSYAQMFKIVNSTDLICTPLHKIETVHVVKHTHSDLASQFVLIEPTGRDIRHINAVQAVAVSRAVFQSISDPPTQAYYQNGTSLSSNTFFNILQNPRFSKLDGSDAYQFWHKSGNLERGSSRLYQSIAAQVAALKLLSPANYTIEGQVIENRLRLFVRPLSLALIEAGLVILIAVAGFILASASGSPLGHDQAPLMVWRPS